MANDEHPPTVIHMISRFVAGEFFIKTEVERTAYLDLLGDALQNSDWKCIGYAIMSSHIHHAVVAGREARAKWLREAHSPFGAWINERSDRFGAVFAKGLVAKVVSADDVAKVLAYIHNNPVRAGVVQTASESLWTSHQAYLGWCPRPSWLNTALGFSLMGIPDGERFDELVRAEATRPRTAARRRGRPKKTEG